MHGPIHTHPVAPSQAFATMSPSVPPSGAPRGIRHLPVFILVPYGHLGVWLGEVEFYFIINQLFICLQNSEQ